MFKKSFSYTPKLFIHQSSMNEYDPSKRIVFPQIYIDMYLNNTIIYVCICNPMFYRLNVLP